MNRRTLLQTLSVGAFAAVTASSPALFAQAKGKNKIHQSASLWCYNNTMKKKNMSLEDFIVAAKEIGLEGLDLMGPDKFELLAKHGMVCTMTQSTSIQDGFNTVANHENMIKVLTERIDANAKFGFPNVITFSGNCRGMSREEGLKNCVEGLKKIVGYAEQKKVTICMEYLNSKGHKDYMCDNTQWAVELVKQVGSERFKILYDIFHADMMEEDVFGDIEKYYECFGHYHTGGYPGRAEIDSRQKRDYRALMEVIYKTGYTGYVAHEFVPRDEDGLKSLKTAYDICNIGN